MKNKGWIVLLFVFGTGFLFAQQEVNYALYKRHFNIINPGVAGVGQSTFLNLSICTQWTGIKNAPETQALSYSTPYQNKKVGLGFTVINDKVSIERQTQIYADFSYRLDTAGETKVFLGLKGGGNLFRLLVDDVLIFDENGQITDPSIRTFSGFLPNVGVGVYIHNSEKFFISLSVPRILNAKRFKEQDGQITVATYRPDFFTSVGVHLKTSIDWTLIPSFLLSTVENAPSSLIFDLGLSYKKEFDFGVQYSDAQSIGGNTFFNVNENLQFGYAYNTPINTQLRASALATHEIVLKIKLIE